MKIFFTHNRHSNFENELYKPLRQSALNSEHEIILPHEGGRAQNTKELIKSAGLVAAEVSEPATGVGIELGWADAFNVPIVCMHKKGTKLSNSLKYITKDFIEYENSDDMIRKLSELFSIHV